MMSRYRSTSIWLAASALPMVAACTAPRVLPSYQVLETNFHAFEYTPGRPIETADIQCFRLRLVRRRTQGSASDEFIAQISGQRVSRSSRAFPTAQRALNRFFENTTETESLDPEKLELLARRHGTIAALAGVVASHAGQPVDPDFAREFDRSWSTFLEMDMDEMCRLLDGTVLRNGPGNPWDGITSIQGMTWQKSNTVLRIRGQSGDLELTPETGGFFLLGACLPAICRIWADSHISHTPRTRP